MNISLDNLGPRDRILTTASRLFYAQGYHATGINQIILEAQVAKASFYDHFGSKEELAVAYLEQRRGRWIHLLTEAAAGPADPAARILALFGFLEAWVRETDFRGCAFLNIASEFPTTENRIRATVAAHKQAQWELIHSLVGTATPAAQIQFRTNTVFLLFESALIESRTFRDVWPVHAAREAVAHMLA